MVTVRLPVVVAVLLLITGLLVGVTAWWHTNQAETAPPAHNRGRAVRALTVDAALRLCPRGMNGSVGRVTVEGYLGDVRVAEITGTLQGLFPSPEAALSQSRTTAPVYPPSTTAIWLRGAREPDSASVPNSTAQLTVTGKLECIAQLPGAGDNGGTFAWLILRR